MPNDTRINLTSNNMQRDISPDVLRTFVKLSHLRSYTITARTIGMTQPAVSSQMKRLEQSLGRSIFDKSVPGVHLTPYGQSFLVQANEILRLYDQIDIQCSDAA